MSHPSPQSIVLTALSQPRLAPYLQETHGHRKKALTLYRWNMELSAALQATLGVTEVMLRNSLDNSLRKWNDSQPDYDENWLQNPAAPLRGLIAGKRNSAVKLAQKNKSLRRTGHPRFDVPVTHDDILANIPFGMWKEILPNHAPHANPSEQANLNRVFMWQECLQRAFPYEQDHTGEITFWRVFHIHALRNRVSHMDSLLNVDVIDELNSKLFPLLGSISPALREWVTGSSTVKEVWNNRP